MIPRRRPQPTEAATTPAPEARPEATPAPAAKKRRGKLASARASYPPQTIVANWHYSRADTRVLTGLSVSSKICAEQNGLLRVFRLTGEQGQGKPPRRGFDPALAR